MSRPLAVGAALAGAGAAVLALRLAQLQPGLLYPDTYQYLEMARGIARSGRPLVELGPGGDTFVPNADAAAKPLFPALVAVGTLVGLPLLTAARLLTALGSAAAVLLTGAVALRLTASRAGAVVAAGAVLASPSLADWSGFAGPDPLAQALALGAGLAVASRRPAAAGVLAGLAGTTRPELLLPAVVALGAALLVPRLRVAARRAAIAGALAIGAVVLAVRPPLAAPEPRLLAAGAVTAAVVAVAARLRPAQILLGLVGAGALVVVPPGGLLALWHSDWPLLLLGAVGTVAALCGPRRGAALAVLACGLLLGAVYSAKNPGSERYFVQLVPVAALLTGLGAAAVPRRHRLRAGGVALAALAAFAFAVPAAKRSPDGFRGLARGADRLLAPSEPLVTAAPEAYGFWLPQRPVRLLRRGERGLIVLDAAQRAYAPRARASGVRIAHLRAPRGFLRPDGTLDYAPAVVVRGVAR